MRIQSNSSSIKKLFNDTPHLNTSFPTHNKLIYEDKNNVDILTQSQASEIGNVLFDLSLDSQKMPVPIPFTFLPVAESPPVLKSKEQRITSSETRNMIKNSSSGLLQTLIKQFSGPKENVQQKDMKLFNEVNDEGKNCDKEVIQKLVDNEEEDQMSSKEEQSESDNSQNNEEVICSKNNQSIDEVKDCNTSKLTNKHSNKLAKDSLESDVEKDNNELSEENNTQEHAPTINSEKDILNSNRQEEAERLRDAEKEIDAILNSIHVSKEELRQEYSIKANKIENYLEWNSGGNSKSPPYKQPDYDPNDNDNPSKNCLLSEEQDLLNDDMQQSQDNEVQEKLKELDNEISILKQEQETIRKQKEEYDALFEMLQEEMESFYKQRDYDIKQFEKEKEEHEKDIAKQKQELEYQAKVLNKKDKEEIVNLKRQIAKLKEELKAKDESRKSLFNKMKKEMEEVVKKNSELQKKIKQLVSQNKGIRENKSQSRMKTPDAKVLRMDGSIKSEREGPRKSIKKQIDKSPLKNCNSLLVNAKQNTKPKEDNNDIMASKIRSLDLTNKSDILNSSHKIEDNAIYDMVFPDKYHIKNVKVLSTSTSQDGKTTRIFSNGKVEVIFANGVKKETFPDSYAIVYFNNKDIKQTYPDGRVVYYFAEARTTQTTFPDGVQAFKFPNKQLEKHYPDGRKEIM